MSFCLRLYSGVWAAPSTSTPRGPTSRMDSAIQRIPIGLVSHVFYSCYITWCCIFWYITKLFLWKFFKIACKRELGKTTVDRRHGQLTVVFLKGEILTGVFFFILIYSNLKEYKNGLVKIIIFPLINFCRFIKQVKHNRYCIIDLYMHKRVR